MPDLPLLPPPPGETPRKLGRGEIVHGAAPLFAAGEEEALRKMMAERGEAFAAQFDAAVFGATSTATLNGITYVTFKRGGR
jgi:hypothetical protein